MRLKESLHDELEFAIYICNYFSTKHDLILRVLEHGIAGQISLISNNFLLNKSLYDNKEAIVCVIN